MANRALLQAAQITAGNGGNPEKAYRVHGGVAERENGAVSAYGAFPPSGSYMYRLGKGIRYSLVRLLFSLPGNPLACARITGRCCSPGRGG
jgi:hypothetical protein